jgi:hypothetical protein
MFESEYEVDYDQESEISFEDEDMERDSLWPFGWTNTPSDISPELRRNTLFASDDYGGIDIDVEQYVSDLMMASSNIIHHEIGYRFSGMVFSADAVRMSAAYDEDETRRVRLRFNPSQCEDSNFSEVLRESISTGTTPICKMEKDDEFSDSVVGYFIVWKIKSVDLWFEKISHSTRMVTSVVGNEQIHPGIFVKKIQNTHSVNYTNMDCLFICLNEATGKRFRPENIRKQIWPTVDKNELLQKSLHTKRHITFVCDKYNVRLELYDVSLKKWMGYNREGENLVKVIKVGAVVGLFDRFENVENDSLESSSKVKWAYYDLETVQSTSDNRQRIYSYVFIAFPDVKEVVCHHDVDVVEGLLCAKIVEYLVKTPGCVTYLAAWNASRFDARILLPLLKDSKVGVKGVIINGANELLSATIYAGRESGIIRLRDPCKMFPGSLKDMAELFELNMAKGFLDHNIVEQKYISGEVEWEKYISDNKDKILEYVEKDGDVLSKVTESIKILYETVINNKRINFSTCISRSMASNMLWKKFLSQSAKKMLKSFPVGPYYKVVTGKGKLQLANLMDHVVAARCQAPTGRRHVQDVVCVDARSMYPSRAVLEWYPCGNISGVKEFVSGKLGMYNVQIRSQNHPSVIPYRETRLDTYDWSPKVKFEKWVTSIDVEELYENGADFDILDGFVWEGKTKEYFSTFMQTLYDLRHQNRDVKTLNMHYKILMNSLLGNLLQEQLREMVVIMKTSTISEFQKKYDSVISVIDVCEFSETESFFVFRPRRLDASDRQLIELQQTVCSDAIVTKPGLLTWFVFAYSRRNLRKIWTSVESSECEMIYCDTDSLFFTNTNVALSKLNEMGVLGSELGQWSLEYEKSEMVLIRPKFYALRANGRNDKIRVKGVNMNSCCYVVEPSESKTSEWKDKTFDEKAEIYRMLRDESASFGPKFEHVLEVYNGKVLRSVDFQMNKCLDGIDKIYVRKNMK